ncbi:6-phosphogluconate dehydrogenase C-terminal domain-like protein [Hortaea werneckii]|nr:6-phosphogluconate dehydrogenase C-terminal domain-like protein [Hortaea werneckii]KAI7595302.1 6-phosphogluconate dehydrogenase C-terminal domain-like protein [Hortaea werneckii]RMY16165.1 hypothetical protein D0868_00464 [Hortaea werneckii]
MSKTKVLIVGGGGVGTMAAYALQSGGNAEVHVVLRSNFDTVKSRGFDIDSLQHGAGIKGFRPHAVFDRVPQTAAGEGRPYDYVIVATKNVPDNKPTVVELITPAVTPGITAILLLQNGLNIQQPVISQFPKNVVLSGVSLIGATETSHGVVRHDDSDDSKIGCFPESASLVSQAVAETSARRLIEVYNACGKVEWVYDEDVPFTRWRKLLYNSSFNSVAAVTGMDTARMRKAESPIDDLILPIMREIKAIAGAAGVHLPEGVEEKIVRIDPTDTAFIPSMGQDALKGNLMEIEPIVGEPVREATRLGVPTPVLTTLYRVLKIKQLQAKEQRGLWTADFPQGARYN